MSVLSHSRRHVFRHFLLHLSVLALLSPLIFVGAMLHLPAYPICTPFARLSRKHGVDAIAPTVKILAATAPMPLTWLVVCGIVYFQFG